MHMRRHVSQATPHILLKICRTADVEQQEMMRSAAESATASMFPWERQQMDGTKRPLTTFEKTYWGLFAAAISYLVGVNLYRYYFKKPPPKV